MNLFRLAHVERFSSVITFHDLYNSINLIVFLRSQIIVKFDIEYRNSAIALTAVFVVDLCHWNRLSDHPFLLD